MDDCQDEAFGPDSSFLAADARPDQFEPKPEEDAEQDQPWQAHSECRDYGGKCAGQIIEESPESVAQRTERTR